MSRPCVMKWCCCFLAFALGWYVPRLAQAQWIVEDPLQIANSARQIIYEYNILLASLDQITNQVKNLQRIQEAVVMIDVLMEKQRQLDEVFNRAQAISFNLATAERQFTQLYGGTPSGMSTVDLLAYKRRLLAARFEASRHGVSMQAVQQNIVSLYGNIVGLLRAVWVASGALDMAQMQAQQQALQLHAQQQALAMHAAAQRLEAMRQAEDVANTQLAIQMYLEATTLRPLQDWRSGPQLSYDVKGTL